MLFLPLMLSTLTKISDIHQGLDKPKIHHKYADAFENENWSSKHILLIFSPPPKEKKNISKFSNVCYILTAHTLTINKSFGKVATSRHTKRKQFYLHFKSLLVDKHVGYIHEKITENLCWQQKEAQLMILG